MSTEAKIMYVWLLKEYKNSLLQELVMQRYHKAKGRTRLTILADFHQVDREYRNEARKFITMQLT